MSDDNELINRAKVLVAAGAIVEGEAHKQYYLNELANLLGLRFNVISVEPGCKPYPDLAGDCDWQGIWDK